jgi:hypothetical protein
MPKDPHITGGIRHDWAAIKHEYVTDPDASLRKIAKKYGVSLNAIAKKSKAEDWFATRKKTQTRIVTKGITKTVNRMANELSKESDFLDRMKGHMDRMLKDDLQYQRHLVENKTFGEDGSMVITTEEKLYNKFDSRAMKDSMQILQMMESMTRSLYNIQKAEALERQQIERERLEIERERLALERERNALKTGNMENDSTRYGVVLIPERDSND